MPSQWAKKPVKKQRVSRKRISQSIRNFMQAQIAGQQRRKEHE
jgi:hypothetical protein